MTTPQECKNRQAGRYCGVPSRLLSSDGLLVTNPFLVTHERSDRKSLTDGRPPCKSSVKRKQRSPDARFRGARKNAYARTFSSHVCLAAMVPAFRRTGHPLAVSGPEGPSPMIEFVFSASPENNPKEPLEIAPHRPVGHWRDLAACALVVLFLSPAGRAV